jgi:hypothetical protein
MSATSLISFDASANAVTSYNEKMKTTTLRLLTAKEFKTARGLKGNAASVAYNAYIREHGLANTAGLAAALTSGELLVRSARDSSKSLNVSFVKKSAIKDPAVKSAPAPEVTALETEVANLKAMLAGLGAKAEEIAAARPSAV